LLRTVAIDCFERDFPGFRPGYAVVAVDVIRATTTAVTAVLTGRRCFPAATIDAAVQVAQHLDAPLLVGELGGTLPDRFDLDNSPAALAERSDISRPMVLVSTSGTPLICEAAQSGASVYAACLRNFAAQAAFLIARHPRVALIGAGSRGEFREEDQLCCAWIAERLVQAGYAPLGDVLSLIDRWNNASPSDILVSNSVHYLSSTGRMRDLDFILNHVDDNQDVFEFQRGEIAVCHGQPV
jgi:2-phosphosulfolactate phosphatase